MVEINEILSEIRSEIQKYFNSNEDYRDIYVSDISIECIRIKNKFDKVEIKILFNKLFEKYDISDEDLIQRYKRILNRLKHNCDDWFWELSTNNCYTDVKNTNLETWYNKSTLYEYRGIIGFYNIRGKKAEFIMEESRTIPRDQDGNLLKRGLTLEFNIDNINIKISNPSPVFKLIFKRFINWGWEYFKTIKLENVNRNPLEDYLQQALFINNLYNQVEGESLIKFGIEREFKHYSDYYNYEKTNCILNLPMSKFIEPLAFYNQAFNGTDETAFLYYYRILEYFYTNDKIKLNGHNHEDECLERLLLELKTDYCIENIIDNNFFEYMLDDEDKNNIDFNNISIKKFAEKLYQYRNSVVHSKKEENLLSHVPVNLLTKQGRDKLKGWNSIINTLAEICIQHFCFDDKDISDFIVRV